MADGDGVKKKPGAGTDRLRFSSWLDPLDLLLLKHDANLKSKRTPILKPNSAGRAGPVLDTSTLDGQDGLIDDISLQRTLRNDEQMKVVWDTQFLTFLVVPSSTKDPNMLDPEKRKVKQKELDDDRLEYFKTCVKAAHQRQMQFLAGYALLKPKPPGPNASDLDKHFFQSELGKFVAFNNWIKQPSLTNPSVDAFTQSIVTFLDQLGCDGISFDIEGLSTGLPLETQGMPAAQFKSLQQARLAECHRLAGNIGTFYATLADKLSATKRLVAVATAGLTSPDHIQNTVPPDMFLIQGFDVGQGRPNVLIRPMAYDNFTANVRDDDPLIKDWHQQIVDFALKQVSNSQFQLGIRTTQRTGFGAFITRTDVLQDRCTNMLRADKKVGLILFPTSQSHWKDCDDALNPKPNTPAAGKFKDQPVQIKLLQEGLDRLRS
jgi:hypothetical protein